MIKFKGDGPGGRPLYGFGITKLNVEKLKAGQPIHIDLEEMGGSGSVMIFYGRSEKTIYDMLKREEFIRPDVAIHEDRFDEHGAPPKKPVN